MRLVPSCSVARRSPCLLRGTPLSTAMLAGIASLRGGRVAVGSRRSSSARAHASSQDSTPSAARAIASRDGRDLGRVKRLEHEAHRVRPAGRAADADPQARKSLPEHRNQRGDPVVSPRSAVPAQANLPERQVEIVVDRENVRRVQTIEPTQFRDGLSARVHEGLGFARHDPGPRDLARRRARPRDDVRRRRSASVPRARRPP